MSGSSRKTSDRDALETHLEQLATRLAPLLQDDATGPVDPESRRLIDDLFQRFHEPLEAEADRFLAQERRRGKAAALGSASGPSLLTELWIRFSKRPGIALQGKRLFFFVFYEQCRRTLIDRWRKRQRQRNLVVSQPSIVAAQIGSDVDYERIDQLLCDLQNEEWRAAMVARAYLLGHVQVGDTLVQQPIQFAEIAEMSGYSLRTIEQDWHYAKCFLRAQIDLEPR